MAHGIYGDRFYSFRQPAWHGIRPPFETPHTAVEALEAIGSYDVTIEDTQTVSGLKLSQRAIVRLPTTDDPEPRELGFVGPDYTLVTPREICELWDTAVRAPVETMAALFNGGTLFLSTGLPDSTVKGDEIKNYLLVNSPMSGMEALQARVTPVRAVCANTLATAKTMSTETYRIVHDKHARLKLQAAMEGIYDRAVGRVGRLTEIFNLMADRSITEEELNLLLEQVYALPAMPDPNAPPEIVESRMITFELNSKYQQARREAVRGSFEGKGVGSESLAAKGTAWGAYQAIAEVEQYSRSRTIATRAIDTLFGYRAGVIEKAYGKVAALVIC